MLKQLRQKIIDLFKKPPEQSIEELRKKYNYDAPEGYVVVHPENIDDDTRCQFDFGISDED